MGCKAKITKSKVWYSPNIALGMIQEITRNFGISSTKELETYLGAPLFHGRAGTQYFNTLVEKVQRKLSSWKQNLFSRAARLVLIQSVTSTIPTYTMQTCKVPKSILVQLERINCRFFSGDKEQERTTHNISWERICWPKTLGTTFFVFLGTCICVPFLYSLFYCY